MNSLLMSINDLFKYRALMLVMVRRELAARYAGTALGIFWPYMQPLLTIAAYYLVFDVIFSMRLSNGAPTHAVGLFLITGALPWMAFCDAISRGMNSLIDAGAMLQKNALPIALFPVRTVLASSFIYFPLIFLVVIFYMPLHHFDASVFATIPLMLMQLSMTLLLAFVLAIFASALRDVVQLIGFFLAIGIYITPVLFPLNMFPDSWRWVLWLNPMTSYVLGYQSILLKGEWPSVTVWLIGFFWILLLIILLNLLIERSKDQIVDWL